MFIKSLIIESIDGSVRDMRFERGLNLIIDNTPTEDIKLTGNNVGKTTVLKLIDFCLGGKPDLIYTDTENRKEIYRLVRKYLEERQVKICLRLSENLDEDGLRDITIERNFIKGKKAIRRINGEQLLDKDFEDRLRQLLFPLLKAEKPSLRQLISHNIRYKDDSINNTLKTLNSFTTDIEYETLYLYMLGCTFDEGAKKQALVSKMKQEELFKERLETEQTRNAYAFTLSILEDEIAALNEKKSKLNINENFEEDLHSLNTIKYHINKASSVISRLNIRKNIIDEAVKEMETDYCNIDLSQLELLYAEAMANVSGIQKTFEDLVKYHNRMLMEKERFIRSELPELERMIASENKKISRLLEEEKEMSQRIAKSDSFGELESLISELNEKYRLKGECEAVISQVETAEKNMVDLQKEIDEIDKSLFSEDFEEILKMQLVKFNKKFAAISNELYGERYALKYDIAVNKKTGQQYYKFSAFNANMSSGKKQGEILCFDLAYTMFADEEGIPCLHFLLNDKKELMHDNQLLKVCDYVKGKDIQLVISILKDKLPPGLMNEANIVVELSQESKLFKIESVKF